MGGTQSSTAIKRQEEDVFKMLQGVVLRSSGSLSQLEILLRDTLRLVPGKDGMHSGLYVVRGGKDLEARGLAPTFQSGENKFIVRPLSKEYIRKTYTLASSSVQNGTEAVYAILSGIIFITMVCMASPLQDNTSIVKQAEMSSKKVSEKTKGYNEKFLTLFQEYSSQKAEPEQNEESNNVLFTVQKYSEIRDSVLDKVKKRYSSRQGVSEQKESGSFILHERFLRSIDSFAICSTNHRTRVSGLLRLLKTSATNPGIVETYINTILSGDFVKSWVQTKPELRSKIGTILGGFRRKVRLTQTDGTFQEIIQSIMKKMRDHLEGVCIENKSLKAYSGGSDKVMAYDSKIKEYKYSKEALPMVINIYKKFELETRKMQSNVLNAFYSLFEINNKAQDYTVSIKSNYENKYLCVKRGVLENKDPGVKIMDTFLNISQAYFNYLINMNELLQATVTKRLQIR